MINKVIKWVEKWCYAGVNRSFFIKNKKVINDLNTGTLKMVANTGIIFMAVLTVMCLRVDVVNTRFSLYFVYLIFFIIYRMGCNHLKRFYGEIPKPYAYLCIAAYYIFGILLGCIFSTKLPAMMFNVFVIVVPLMIIIPPIEVNIITLIAVIVFIYTSLITKRLDIAILDTINCLCCFVINLIFSYLITSVKVKELNIRLSLEEKCNIDDMTGLFNRRNFNFNIKSKFCDENIDRISIIMMDIDNFKNYNDTYGHISGDKCLRIVGKTLKRINKRFGIYIARYGGEEFVAIDIDHSINQLEEITREMIAEINSINIVNVNSPYKKITMSAGIASREISEVKSYIDLINLADEALYQAKSNGKNTVVIYQNSVMKAE